MYKTLFFSVILLTACSGAKIEDYQHHTPEFDLREFFDGSLVAYGMLQDRSGLVTRRFSATIEGSWNGNEGILDEKFIFDDGVEEERIWQLTYHGDGRYTGTAGDVVGEAEGLVSGSAFQWGYQLTVPYNDGEIVVTLDDWLYLLDEDRLLNRTVLTKFGFRVGELTLYIEKQN